jgi:hypothetical protein
VLATFNTRYRELRTVRMEFLVGTPTSRRLRI